MSGRFDWMWDPLENLLGLDKWGQNNDYMGMNDKPILANENAGYRADGQDLFGAGAGQGGWGTMGTWGNAMQGIGGLAQAWLGYENLQLNEEKYNTSKDIWNAEREANRTVTNADIMDRQAARISSTGNNNAAGNYNSMNYTRANDTVKKVTV